MCTGNKISYLVGVGLTFDALVKPEHLPNLYVLLRRHPNLSLVIDHGAKPDIANAQFKSWADNIELIANKTNAYCKLSGLLTEVADDPSYERVQPYMQHLLDCFGAKRLMWGSDWPVLEMVSDYTSWSDMVDIFLAQVSDQEQAAILGENAMRFYGITKNTS